MKTTKVLLYCTKGKPYLYSIIYGNWGTTKQTTAGAKNEYIVAECEVETETRLNYGLERRSEFILENTGLTMAQLDAYLPKHKEYDSEDVYYALHISNLNIFAIPQRINEYWGWESNKLVTKAPQNMMRAYDRFGNKYILISIRPEWLCKILNGEKTIEVRKKVLKEMLPDE